MCKKIAFLFFTVLIITSSCQDAEISNSQADNLNILNDLVHKKDGKSYMGHITTFVTNENEFVVKVSGKKNKLYILQNNEMPNNLNLDGVNGHIIYLKDALIISANNKNYFIGLNRSGEKNQNILDDVQSRLSLSNTILGYGLTEMGIDDFEKYNFSTDKSIYFSLLEPTVDRNEINLLLKEPICQHGGRGAISCSASNPYSGSCSTSCSSGYYACCNSSPLSCKCYSDSP